MWVAHRKMWPCANFFLAILNLREKYARTEFYVFQLIWHGFFCSKSIQLRGCVHLHHLSIDNSRVLAAVRGCRMWVVGLCCHWLYGDKLQGARGGVIWIWRTEKEFTHKETTNTSNHYIVSQRGINGHTLSLSICLITTPACPPKGSCHLLTLGIMSNISCLCQQTSFWMETIDHKDRFDFQTCGIASLW